MRVILIDPFACAVTDATLPDIRPGDYGAAAQRGLEAMYRLLSHESYQVDSLDSVRLGVNEHLVVGGHGLLDGPARWFKLVGLHFETLAGKGLIVGSDAESNEIDTEFKVSDIDYRTVFYERVRGGLRSTTQPWVKPQ